MRASKIHSIVVVGLLISLWTCAGWPQALRVVGFNVESGGARPDMQEVGSDGVPHDGSTEGTFAQGALRQVGLNMSLLLCGNAAGCVPW
jgi:hypothetical protein